jgi:hypothetical protein
LTAGLDVFLPPPRRASTWLSNGAIHRKGGGIMGEEICLLFVVIICVIAVLSKKGFVEIKVTILKMLAFTVTTKEKDSVAPRKPRNP